MNLSDNLLKIPAYFYTQEPKNKQYADALWFQRDITKVGQSYDFDLTLLIYLNHLTQIHSQFFSDFEEKDECLKDTKYYIRKLSLSNLRIIIRQKKFKKINQRQLKSTEMLQKNSANSVDNFRGSFNYSAATTRVNTNNQTLNRTSAQDLLSSQLGKQETRSQLHKYPSRSATPQIFDSKSELAKVSANMTTKVSTQFPSTQSLHLQQPQQQHVSMMDARILAPNIDNEIHWVSKQSQNKGFEFSQTPKNFHNSRRMQGKSLNNTAERKAAFRETDFQSNNRFHQQRDCMLGRKHQDTSPVFKSRDHSVDSRSAGRKTFSNLKNHSQFSIGHSQSKPDLSSNLHIQETFAVDAPWTNNFSNEFPKSTAQNDFSMNLLFQNHKARPTTPQLQRNNNRSQLNLLWNEDQASMLRNSNSQRPTINNSQSCTNLSHNVERLIKNFPDSGAVQEAHAERARSHLGNKSSPGLLRALHHVSRKVISKTSTVQGRLDLAHEKMSNTGNFQSVSQKCLDHKDLGKGLKFSTGKKIDKHNQRQKVSQIGDLLGGNQWYDSNKLATVSLESTSNLVTQHGGKSKDRRSYRSRSQNRRNEATFDFKQQTVFQKENIVNKPSKRTSIEQRNQTNVKPSTFFRYENIKGKENQSLPVNRVILGDLTPEELEQMKEKSLRKTPRVLNHTSAVPIPATFEKDEQFSATDFSQRSMMSALVSEFKAKQARKQCSFNKGQHKKSTPLIRLKKPGNDQKFSNKRSGIYEEGGEFFSRDYQLERSRQRQEKLEQDTLHAERALFMAQDSSLKEMPEDYHHPRHFSKHSSDSRMVTHRLRDTQRQEARELVAQSLPQSQFSSTVAASKLQTPQGPGTRLDLGDEQADYMQTLKQAQLKQLSHDLRSQIASKLKHRQVEKIQELKEDRALQMRQQYLDECMDQKQKIMRIEKVLQTNRDLEMVQQDILAKKQRAHQEKIKDRNDIIESQSSGFLGTKPAAIRSQSNKSQAQLAKFVKGLTRAQSRAREAQNPEKLNKRSKALANKAMRGGSTAKLRGNY